MFRSISIVPVGQQGVPVGVVGLEGFHPVELVVYVQIWETGLLIQPIERPT